METNAPKVPPPPSVTEPPKIQTRTDPSPVAAASGPASAPAPAPAANVPADISQPADYRLVIEKDPVSGTFIYKTIDRFSGAVVNQFPREELIRLGDSQTYTAGKIFTARV